MSIEHAMNKKLQIHNSTAEFFIFQIENNIYKIYFKAKNYKKTQSVGNSDELLPMAKATQLNITSLPFAAMSLIRKDLRNTVSFKTVYSNPILINTRQITFLILITK